MNSTNIIYKSYKLIDFCSTIWVKEKKKEEKKEEKSTRKDSLVISISVIFALVAILGMAVVGTGQEYESPFNYQSPIVQKPMVVNDLGLTLSFGCPDKVADMLQHLYNDHKVLNIHLVNGQELILTSFKDVDSVVGFIKDHDLLEHVSYVQMRNGNKVFPEKKQQQELSTLN